MTKIAWICVLWCFAAAAAHAQAPAPDGAQDAGDVAAMEAQGDAHRAYASRVAAGLSRNGDARALAFAALLDRMASAPTGDAMPAGDAPSTRASRDPHADAQVRAAATQAGDDVVANLLVIAAAGEDGDASLRDASARRWQAADAGNLLPLLFLSMPVDALLVEARRATHADMPMYETVRWMASAYLRHPPTADELALLSSGEGQSVADVASLMAMGLWSATVAPDYEALMQACRDDALRATPTRAADCRHVATLLADRAGSALDRSIGLAMLDSLARDAAERSAIDARRLHMDWQMLEWGRVAAQQPDGGAAQFVRLLSDPAVRTEQQLLERVLQEAGVPLAPPAGWRPPRRD